MYGRCRATRCGVVWDGAEGLQQQQPQVIGSIRGGPQFSRAAEDRPGKAGAGNTY
jgi:hypothetical protein